MDTIQKKNSKIPLFIVAIVIIIATVAVAVIISTSNGKSRKLQNSLELGAKALLELDYDTVIAAYEQALTIDPSLAEAYVGLIKAYIAMGDFDKANEIIEAAYANVNPEDIPLIDEAGKVILAAPSSDINYGYDIVVANEERTTPTGIRYYIREATFDFDIINANIDDGFWEVTIVPRGYINGYSNLECDLGIASYGINSSLDSFDGDTSIMEYWKEQFTPSGSSNGHYTMGCKLDEEPCEFASELIFAFDLNFGYLGYAIFDIDIP